MLHVILFSVINLMSSERAFIVINFAQKYDIRILKKLNQPHFDLDIY